MADVAAAGPTPQRNGSLPRVPSMSRGVKKTPGGPAPAAAADVVPAPSPARVPSMRMPPKTRMPPKATSSPPRAASATAVSPSPPPASRPAAGTAVAAAVGPAPAAAGPPPRDRPSGTPTPTAAPQRPAAGSGTRHEADQSPNEFIDAAEPSPRGPAASSPPPGQARPRTPPPAAASPEARHLDGEFGAELPGTSGESTPDHRPGNAATDPGGATPRESTPPPSQHQSTRTEPSPPRPASPPAAPAPTAAAPSNSRPPHDSLTPPSSSSGASPSPPRGGALAGKTAPANPSSSQSQPAQLPAAQGSGSTGVVASPPPPHRPAPSTVTPTTTTGPAAQPTAHRPTTVADGSGSSSQQQQVGSRPSDSGARPPPPPPSATAAGATPAAASPSSTTTAQSPSVRQAESASPGRRSPSILVEEYGSSPRRRVPELQGQRPAAAYELFFDHPGRKTASRSPERPRLPRLNHGPTAADDGPQLGSVSRGRVSQPSPYSPSSFVRAVSSSPSRRGQQVGGPAGIDSYHGGYPATAACVVDLAVDLSEAVGLAVSDLDLAVLCVRDAHDRAVLVDCLAVDPLLRLARAGDTILRGRWHHSPTTRFAGAGGGGAAVALCVELRYGHFPNGSSALVAEASIPGHVLTEGTARSEGAEHVALVRADAPYASAARNAPMVTVSWSRVGYPGAASSGAPYRPPSPPLAVSSFRHDYSNSRMDRSATRYADLPVGGTSSPAATTASSFRGDYYHDYRGGEAAAAAARAGVSPARLHERERIERELAEAEARVHRLRSERSRLGGWDLHDTVATPHRFP